ncbi:MAG: hypothetical protein ABID09_07240 [Candidatus Omnitrophota bacterium]
MRELIFKELTKAAAMKREVSVEEIVERGGVVSLTRKRSTYFVRGVHRIESQEGLKRWINTRKKDLSLNRRFFHILRKYSKKLNEDKLICKMRGSFYVICGESAYNVVFVHAIKIKVMKPE